MGFLGNLFSGKNEQTFDVEQAMESLEDESVDVLHEAADYYVKPLSLETDADMAVVENELKSRNVVLLNIAPFARNPAKLKDSLSKLTALTSSINGDIARISEDKVIITPARMKIVKQARK